MDIVVILVRVLCIATQRESAAVRDAVLSVHGVRRRRIRVVLDGKRAAPTTTVSTWSSVSGPGPRRALRSCTIPAFDANPPGRLLLLRSGIYPTQRFTMWHTRRKFAPFGKDLVAKKKSGRDGPCNLQGTCKLRCDGNFRKLSAETTAWSVPTIPLRTGKLANGELKSFPP